MNPDFNYTTILLDLMEMIESQNKTSKLTGEEKRDRVIQLFSDIVTDQFGENTWILQFKPIIPTLIEFIVSISRKDIKIQLNKVKRCCFT